ncbi:hypothetical protein ES703_111729 [subsurface metagenome]
MGCSWPGLVPEVFTDADTDTNASYGVYRTLLPRLEVAVLIKDTIVGQVYLVIDTNQLAIVDDCGRIVNVAFGIDETDHDSKPCGVFDHSVKRPLILFNKLRLK